MPTGCARQTRCRNARTLGGRAERSGSHRYQPRPAGGGGHRAITERPTYLIFLTDGLPTEGVIDSQHILDNFARGRRRPTCACSSLAWAMMWTPSCWTRWRRSTTAASTYVLPDERLDEMLSAFYASISTPVLDRPGPGFWWAGGL